MNKNDAIKEIFSYIRNLVDYKIIIYIEETSERQDEYFKKYYNFKKNAMFGASIHIYNKGSNYDFFEFFEVTNYNQFYKKINEILSKIRKKDISNKNANIKVKCVNDKKRYLSKSKKYRIYQQIKNNIDFDRLAFYEQKKKIYILNNQKQHIMYNNEFKTKIMLNVVCNEQLIFDYLLFENGYFNLNKNIENFITKMNQYIKIKSNITKLSNDIYNIMFSNNCGTIFHEIFGHNLEYDINIKKKNKWKRYKNFENCNLTYIDDPYLKSGIKITNDFYGDKRLKKTLIKNGSINVFLKNGTYRVENFRFFPKTRMSNSYLKPSSNKINDIKEKYIFVDKIKYGRMHVDSEKIEIVIDCAILKNNKIEEYYTNLYIYMNLYEFLKKIIYVGNDLNFVPTTCGAESGNVFCFVGMPTIYMRNIYIKQL